MNVMNNAFLYNNKNKSQNSSKKMKAIKSLTTIGKKSQKINNIPLNNSKNSTIFQNKNDKNKINNLIYINSNKTSGNSIFSKNTSSTTTPFVMKNLEFNSSEKNINKNKLHESSEKINSKNGIIKVILKKDNEKNNNVKSINSQSKKEISYNSNKIDFFNKEIKHLRSKSYDMDSSESFSDINVNDFSSLDLTPLPVLDDNDYNKSTLYGAKYLRRLEYDIQINKGFKDLLERKNYYRNKKLSKYYSYLKKFVQITRKLSKRKGGIGEKIIFLRFIYRLNYECYIFNFKYFISKLRKHYTKKKNTKNTKNLKSKKISNNNIICFENKINIIRNKNLNFSIEKNNNFLYKKFKKTFLISKDININILKKERLYDIEKEAEFELVNDKLSINYFNQFIKHLSNIFGENINLSGMRNFPRPICEEGRNKKILKKTYFKRIYNLENKIKFKDIYYNEKSKSSKNNNFDLSLIKKSRSHENTLDDISQKNEEQIDLIDDEIKISYFKNQNKNKHIKLIKKKIKNKLNFITKIIIKNDKSKINNNLINTNSSYKNKNNIKKINNNRLIIDLLIIFINNFWLIKIKKMFFDIFLNDYYYPFKRDKNDYKRFSSKCELMDDDEEKLNKLNSYFSSKKYENNLFKK